MGEAGSVSNNNSGTQADGGSDIISTWLPKSP